MYITETRNVRQLHKRLYYMETDDILVAITQTPQAYSSLQREKSSTVDRVHPSTVQLFKQQQQQQFIYFSIPI